jgi:hypothetical protein
MRDDNQLSRCFSCETNNLMSESAKNAITNKTANDTDDSKIRLYELAMSCTGEYGALFIVVPLLMLIKES